MSHCTLILRYIRSPRAPSFPSEAPSPYPRACPNPSAPLHPGASPTHCIPLSPCIPLVLVPPQMPVLPHVPVHLTIPAHQPHPVHPRSDGADLRTSGNPPPPYWVGWKGIPKPLIGEVSTWTISRSATFPREEMRMSSPSSSTMARGEARGGQQHPSAPHPRVGSHYVPLNLTPTTPKPPCSGMLSPFT